MKLLHVDMRNENIVATDLPKEWQTIGGSGLIARIMNDKVPPETDPLGPENKLIIVCGPLAGTRAPQLGRISVGAKSPLTLGIKEANAGGPAGQYMDRLGFRGIVVENAAKREKLFYLRISRKKARLVPAEEFRGLKNYELVQRLHSKYGKKVAVVCTGVAGERKYKGASVSFTDILGDPSRNAARGGLGAVMGSKGLKAIVLDPSGTPPLNIADPGRFKKTVKSWINTVAHDVSCGLYSKYGTPFAVANSANQGTLPTNNFSSGRPQDFYKVSGETLQENLFKRGGRMHGCMPGCAVKCSIIYPDAEGNRLASAYEYETIAMLGTNLGIMDLDAIGKLKFMCDDIGVDAIEIGPCLGVGADAGKMEMGDPASAEKLLMEIEQGTTFGEALGNGVVSTAKVLNVQRVPAYKGQAFPGHDPRSVKGTGVTYMTSPMGADHTAGLTYRVPRKKEKQARNSLRSQVQAATCDTFGYCLNSIPGGQESVYGFLADLMNARYGIGLTPDDIVEIGKQTLKDQIKFNEKAEFSRMDTLTQNFIRSESLAPADQVFDVPEKELGDFWDRLDTFKVPEKHWEVRIPPMPETLFGTHVVQKTGAMAKRLGMRKAMIVSDSVMKTIGRVNEIETILQRSGIRSVILPPLVCIPTTSGTGSEVNSYAVITDKRRNVKFILVSNHLIPKVAVIDPDYCRSMPPELTRESGIDALAHCIEGYVALAAPYHPYFESMALYGTKLIGRSLVKAYKDGEDLDARTDMCMAALYGGIAFSKGLGLGHAITHVLGAHYHIPHGKAATIGLICFVRANKAICDKQFQELAFMLNGLEDLEEAMLKLYNDIEITATLKSNNIPEGDLKKIAFYTYRDAVNMATNPSRLSERKILSLLEDAYE